MTRWTPGAVAERLATNDWFARQPAALRHSLIAHGHAAELQPGQWTHGQGDEATGLVAVLQGRLRLEAAVGGRANRLCAILGRGAIIGQSALFGGGPRLITAIADGPLTAWRISDAALREIARETPDLWRALAELLYRQLETNIRSRVLALSLSPRARVAAALLDLRATAIDGGTIEIRQADLAELCGLSRQAINGHLHALGESGAIIPDYRMIIVRNWERLEAMLAVQG